MTRARTWTVAVALLVAACGTPAAVSPSGTGTLSTPAATPMRSRSPGPTAIPSSSPTDAPVAGPAVIVTCDGPDASVSAPAVRAMRDGVHIEAVGKDGSPATIDLETAENGWIASTVGAGTLVLEPGRYLVTCLDPSAAAGTRAEVLVTDPDGLWRSAEVECAGAGGTTGGGDSTPAAPDEAIGYLRSIILSFRRDDILEPAGYPAAPSGWIRLVRDGQVVAAWFVTGTAASIGIGSMIHCPGADITYQASG